METVALANFFQILLIIITVAMVANKNNTIVAILFSVSSLFLALLFFLNKAPDVALAEIAVGSAIMPLILIIAISKQREYVVITHVKDDLIIDRSENNETYYLRGKKSSLLISKLENKVKNIENIKIIKEEEVETND